MLEYVRHASGVWWVCLECDAKYIVLVFPRYMKIVRASLVMFEMERR